MSSDELRDEIARRLDLGWSLGEVHAAVIDPGAVNEDERYALWLFAWSHPGSRAAALSACTRQSRNDRARPQR
jgi:hypothetical protein